MTSSTEPADFLVYAPLRVRINCVSTALFVGFMVVAFLGALLGWALNSLWGFLVVGLPLVFPTVWAVGRAVRVRLVVSNERVLINNTWRSYEVRWSEVAGVGIRQATSCFPQPVLWFRLVGRSPVVAQATPVRRSVRQELQTQVLSFAPALVQRLDDELAASWLGTDSAPSYRLRLWWLKRHPNGRWADSSSSLGRNDVPRMKADVVVLVVLVVLVLPSAPGHGLRGWALALGGAVPVGAAFADGGD